MLLESRGRIHHITGKNEHEENVSRMLTSGLLLQAEFLWVLV